MVKKKIYPIHGYLPGSYSGHIHVLGNSTSEIDYLRTSRCLTEIVQEGSAIRFASSSAIATER